MYFNMYVFIYISEHLYVYAFMFKVFIYLCMYLFMYVSLYESLHICICFHICKCTYLHTCILVCMYVSMYLIVHACISYSCIYECMYIHVSMYIIVYECMSWPLTMSMTELVSLVHFLCPNFLSKACIFLLVLVSTFFASKLLTKAKSDSRGRRTLFDLKNRSFLASFLYVRFFKKYGPISASFSFIFVLFF